MGIEQYNRGRETPGRKEPNIGEIGFGVNAQEGIDKLFRGIGSFFERRPEPNRSGVDLYNKDNVNRSSRFGIPDPLELISPKTYDWMNKNIMQPAAKTVADSSRRWNESYLSPVGPINTGETERDWKGQIGDMWKVPLNAIGNAAQLVHESARTLPRGLFGLDVDDEMSIANPFGTHFDKKHAGIGATGYYLDWMSKALTGRDFMPGYNENPLLDPSLSENVMTDEWKNVRDVIITDAGRDKIEKEVNKIYGSVDPDTWVKNNPQGNRSFDAWETDYKKDYDKWSTKYGSLMDEEYSSQIDTLAQSNYERKMLDKYGMVPELDAQGKYIGGQIPYNENFEFGAFDPLVDFVANYRDRKIMDYSSEDAGFLHGADELLEWPILGGLPGLMKKAAKKSPKMAKLITAISPGQAGGKYGEASLRTFVPPFGFQGLEGLISE